MTNATRQARRGPSNAASIGTAAVPPAPVGSAPSERYASNPKSPAQNAVKAR
jgi:hypothetical protein